MGFAWVILDATVVMDGCTKGSPLNWKLLKPYSNAVTGSGMAVIQCPHCGKNVELEDGAPGLFDCPYCKNEFEFEGEAKTITISLRPGEVVITLLSLSIIFGIGAGEGGMTADFCLIISGMLLLVSTVTYVIQQIRFRI